jgi:hypothetical protein
LDSDDELAPGIIEADYDKAMETGADIVEHRAIVYPHSGPVFTWTWMRPRFSVARNRRVVMDYLAGRLNWMLTLKMVRRSLYLRGLELLGADAKTAPIVSAEDRLHCAAIFRLVHLYVATSMIGYIIHDSHTRVSTYRGRHEGLVCHYIAKYIYRRREMARCFPPFP